MAQEQFLISRGVQSLQGRLHSLPDRLQRQIMRGGLRIGGRIILTGSRAEAPIKTSTLFRSGRLRIRSRLRGSVWEASIRFGGPKAFYANIIEGGAKPHRIVAAPGSALKIGPVARAEVMHPGIAARHFMAKARERVGPEAERAFTTFVEGRIARFWETGT